MAEDGGSPRVIFVDDDERVLRGLRLWLGRQVASWDVRYACGGNEALAMMRDWNPDVIVTDMRMPKMDGAELLSIVQESHPLALRIALSGQADGLLAGRGESTSHYWFDKPCERERLIETIRHWMETRAAEDTPRP